MSLNARRSLDPRWIRHHRSVVEGFMIHPIQILRMAPGRQSWDPLTQTIVGGEPEEIWAGPARIQPNKDWRARSVESGVDPQMVHYTRVQISLNKGQPVPHIRVADMVVAQEKTDTDDWVFNHTLSAWTMFVRNAVNSSNRWVYNLLCSADLSDMEEVGS
jgi:hypothetical protein